MVPKNWQSKPAIHASLSQEDTRNSRDDTTHGQATTGQLHWNGNLHGELCATPISPHGATEGNAETGCALQLGSNGK